MNLYNPLAKLSYKVISSFYTGCASEGLKLKLVQDPRACGSYTRVSSITPCCLSLAEAIKVNFERPIYTHHK